MKPTLISLLLMCAVLAASPVLADFYIYKMWQSTVDNHDGTSDRWIEYAFFPGPPSCNDVIDRWHEQKGRDDVSGSKHGVRCEGYCGPDDRDPEVIEINNSMGHYTYYRDQRGELRDTKDNVIGHCHTDASDKVDNCFSTRGDINIVGLWHGGSLVYCDTDLTACKVFYDPRVDKQC